MRKNRFIVLVFFFILHMLSGCADRSEPVPKDFSAGGMTITLTDEYEEKTPASLTAYYQTDRSIVSVLREDYSIFRAQDIDPETFTVGDYAELIKSRNELDMRQASENGVPTLTYDTESRGKSFTYYTTLYKTSDAFWLIQFASNTEDFEAMKPEFQTFMQSVRFG